MSTDAPKVEQVALADIRTDGGTQARAKLDDATVEEYAALIGTGANVPPVVVFYDGETYWLADGFHRVAARAKVGRATVAAEVHQGTRRDAVLYACGANATHGLRRTNADKRRAVETLLRDEEWSQWSDNEIAKRCAVSHPFVGKLRSDLAPTCNGYKSPERKGADGRTIDTSNIGKRKPRVEREPVADEFAVEAYDTPAPDDVPAFVVDPVAPEEPEDCYDDPEPEPEVVVVRPEPFAVPSEPERPRASIDIERRAAEGASKIREAHAALIAWWSSVPPQERDAVLARIERPIHLLLDVVEQFTPAAPKGWRPTVIHGGRS